MNINELDIELLYYGLLCRNEKINIYNEYPCNGGYADVYICGKREPLKHNILIELKYIKKKEYSKKIQIEKRIEAINQLNQYSEDIRIKSDNLKKYIVIFVGNDVKLIEEV